MSYSSLLSGLVLTITALSANLAAGAEFVLQDSQGQPLADAVILIDDAPAASRPPAVMDQISMRFAPNVLVVSPGTLVEFPNSDDVRHHVYSFSPAKRFELRLFQGTEAPPVQFEEEGAVVLGCNIHDQMIGYVLVTSAGAFGVSDADGRVLLPSVEPGNWTVRWWHPSLGEQAPQALGAMELSGAPVQLALPVARDSAAQSAPALSPLQQRFRRAAHDAAH